MPSYHKLFVVLIAQLILLGIVSAQNSDRSVLIISNRVGETIDQHEREQYDLFNAIADFHSAQFYSMPDGKVLLEIVKTEPESAVTDTESYYPSKSELMDYKNKIDKTDHMEEMGTESANSVMDSIKTAISDSLVSIELTDGSILKGHIMEEENQKIQFRTLGGLELTIPQSMVQKISQLGGKVKEGKFYRYDPNYSRLMFTPTGRPLRKGEGYFSDYYVFFPGISYGVTNYFSFMAGFSILPGANFNEQLKYIAPRFAIDLNEKMAVSAGALYASATEDFAAGIGFLIGTYGERDKSLTLGLGLGYTKNEADNFSFGEHPIFVIGGNIRLSNSVSLISENWIITGGDFDLGMQPFAFAFRFFGDHLSGDVGLIIIGDVIKEGFPIPWLSFVYNFGN